MHITLVSSALPPMHDGIGDYTARLAEALVGIGHSVSIATPERGIRINPIDDVSIEQLPGRGYLGQTHSLLSRLRQSETAVGLPDALVLQFNQFSWGKRGFNPLLPRVMRKIKQHWPQVRLGVMFHEKVVPATTWRFRVMRLWQVPQYRELADIADVRFFSIQRWADEERLRRPARPEKDTVHLPVGSNLTRCPPDQAKTRANLGIAEDAMVCGVFGGSHPSRLLNWVADAIRELRRRGVDAVLLYVGPDGEAVRVACRSHSGDAEIPVFDQGRLPATDAASCFPIMDLYLSPFIDGISTRRGSAMAAIQHGVPLVSNRGENTDTFWEGPAWCWTVGDSPGRDDFIRRVVALSEQPHTRKDIGRAGRMAYECEFDWARMADRMVDSLKRAGAKRTSGGKVSDSSNVA